MMELAVISGKGGTGKTSIVAAFATLAGHAMVADCSVEAPNLHLVLGPRLVDRNRLNGRATASIHADSCLACGLCRELCRFCAIAQNGTGDPEQHRPYRVDPVLCEGCGVCAWFCPEAAVSLEMRQAGEWFVSETRYGPMVHASLGVTQRQPAKLVSVVRREARDRAAAHGCDLVIIDGCSGIGWPTVASVRGADLALVVTVPTTAGAHDFVQAVELTQRLGIPTAVCVNRWDLNPDGARAIEEEARARGVSVAGRVRDAPAMSQCQRLQATVIEYTGGAVSQDVRHLWEQVGGTALSDGGGATCIARQNRETGTGWDRP